MVEGHAYGALKNCSSTTYMPRKISVKRKYLPARSRVLSPSSQRCGRGSLKDEVGEPEGSAARLGLVENAAWKPGYLVRTFRERHIALR